MLFVVNVLSNLPTYIIQVCEYRIVTKNNEHFKGQCIYYINLTCAFHNNVYIYPHQGNIVNIETKLHGFDGYFLRLIHF